MHELLLTALLTGATAFGVTGYNNAQPKAINNNNNKISHVQRAYYDADSVSDYGTEAGYFYNYTSYTLNEVERQEGSSIATMAPNDSGQYFYRTRINGTNYNGIKCYGSGVESNSLDIYIDGVLYMSTLTMGGGTLLIEIGEEPDGYIWAFDHSEQPKMEESIFEVVGDTLTAMAGTIGVGFTSIIHIFYNEGVTPLGILALITLGVALVWFAWNLVSSLLRQRR